VQQQRHRLHRLEARVGRQRDALRLAHPLCRAGGGDAVDGDAAGFDVALGVAARAAEFAGEALGQALAVGVGGGG